MSKMRNIVEDNVKLENSKIGFYCKIGNDCVLENSTIDDYSYCEPNCIIQNTIVKKYCDIARNVRIGATQHPIERPTSHHFTYRSEMYQMGEDDIVFFKKRYEKMTIIDEDVWIGHGAIIQAGVHVGVGAVIGSGAVVTKDVPPYAIVVGVPANITRFRFDKEIIEKLLKIAWWNWNDDVIKQRLLDFRMDANEFVEKYGESYE